MKIHFKNLGPIIDATIELGKFTLVAGGNNCGKTYLTYAIFGLLKNWKNNISFHDAIANNLQTNDVNVKFRLNINDLDEKKAFKTFSRNYEKTLDQVFSAKTGSFSDTTIDIEPPVHLIDYLSDHPLEIETDIGNVYAGIDTEGLITVSVDFKTLPKSPYLSILYIDYALITFLYSSYLPTPQISTSERLGIALFYKELDATRNVLVEKLQELVNSSSSKNLHQLVEKEASRFSRPIKENIDFVRNLENIQKQTSSLSDAFRKEILGYITQMLGGKYKIQDQSIYFSNTKKGSAYSVPLHLGSSSVRSLMDIFFYLKHSASDNDLLIIDEPEGHLTPQNQIILTRMLAACMNNGINIYITTHSDYIVKEINNLIMLHGLKDQFKSNYLAKRNTTHKLSEQINPIDIKAYICKKGGLEPCSIDQYGMVVSNIDDAIESINASSAELFDLINRE